MIWSIADLLRGDYKQADYGKVILPLAVMRRLDQALEDTKEDVLAEAEALRKRGFKNVEEPLRIKSKMQFFNSSNLSFPQLLDEPSNIASNLAHYIDGYSALAKAVMENFEFDKQIEKLERANLLYMVVARICDVDLHPDRVSNLEMGYIFEELIRRFSEQSNETAGHHFTPREVVKLMGNLVLDGDEDALTGKGVIRTVYDCACGTGGMLTEVEAHIREINSRAKVHLYGQELNEESYAICLADMLVKGQDASHIVQGNSFSQDGHEGDRFHYCLANPPFGVDWTKVEDEIKDEHDQKGFDGRFGPGLPGIKDGQILFTLHLLSKMRERRRGGTRIAIIHNGSPLFNGGAGSGPSEIRRWILESDYLEAIVALPEQLFYNTGITSYIWLLTNRKAPERAGKVQLIDARDKFEKMSKSLGEKRREISTEQIKEITQLHGAFEDNELVQILPNEAFGYRTVTVDQPLRARWELHDEAWSEVRATAPAKKLEPETLERLIGALEHESGEKFDTEGECVERIREIALGVGIERPAKPLLTNLAKRCQVMDSDAEPVVDSKGNRVADKSLRDTENVPLTQSVEDYLSKEVTPFVPDAWVDDPAGAIGYEIPFTRLFFKQQSPRPSKKIRAEILKIEDDIQELLAEFGE